MGWAIDGIDVEFVADSTPPTITAGREVTLPLLFEYDGSSTVTEPNDSRYGIQYGFNYEGPLTIERFEKNYRDLLAYVRYAGGDVVRRGTSDRGEPWYRERLPDAAPVDSLVVPVDVPADYPETRSMWAIVVGGSDQSTLPGKKRRVDLTLFVLAERSAYDTKADVEAAFGDELTVS